ncbi:MAG: peptidase domain-containing ABC transporter [Ferruginibacter sp.]
MSITHYKQYDAMDCGPTCLRIIASHFGKDFELSFLRSKSFITKLGVSLLGISEAAEQVGFRTLAVKIPIDVLTSEADLPCILHWNQNHFVVLYKIKGGKYYISDPAKGKIKLDKNGFENSWLNTNTEGIALLLETTPDFYKMTGKQSKENGFGFLFKYLSPYKKHIAQLFIGLIIGTGISLLFPFLTQGLVDQGINKQNSNFVLLMLVSQLVLFTGSIIIELVRSWILLHMNSRINIAIISDFLSKLMKLPLSFFETKLIGDIKQRIADHQRIQDFLTQSSLSTLFSMINLVVFGIILGIYSLKMLLLFIIFSTAGILWIFFFLKRRKVLDYKRFKRMGETEGMVFELISGMSEIKLNTAETFKRWAWEKNQQKLFKLNIQTLSLNQYQNVGSQVFDQLKNILISYYAACEVINGNMTLGMMVSVSYIIGQMNSPIDQLLHFIQTAQDAKLSLERLNEIHVKENEEQENNVKMSVENISFNEVSFHYQGEKSPKVLHNINITIPINKITAIVGTSGSGKTTLFKLLLKYYTPTKGNILVGSKNLLDISPKDLRKSCGIVMQDGYIFGDTIANNICLGNEEIDLEKLQNAIHIANIHDFVDSLPNTYNTKIGSTGMGISAGQKQRILIARAVYKNPDFLFFDEATSALDANNEKIIMENLAQFYKNKTVLIIAHRLSTVKNADQIIVLENGSIVEIGNHTELVNKKGQYFELVRNQLDLGE